VRYTIRYTLAAKAEVINAYTWYAQPHINQAGAFLRALERTEAHLAANPALYQQVEDEIRRATPYRSRWNSPHHQRTYRNEIRTENL